jgi:2-amino-4-hydroxy-6-hydroxymethyldihydropteridine diphosphokinase
VARVYLGLGSNIDPEKNLRLAVRELKERFGKLEMSPVYQSRPIGFEGDDFLNAVVALNTSLGPDEVVRQLEEIHVIAGRRRGSLEPASRTLDIDLLLYGELVADAAGVRVPRKDVLEYGFVLRPLTDLAPETVHPVTGRSLATHWREFAMHDAGRHPLTAVDVDLGAG